jgi:hypothetical protein
MGLVRKADWDSYRDSQNRLGRATSDLVRHETGKAAPAEEVMESVNNALVSKVSMLTEAASSTVPRTQPKRRPQSLARTGSSGQSGVASENDQ